MNSDEEFVTYYSNNSVKKFYKKPIGGNFKNSSFKKSSSNFGVQQKSVEKVEEKKEKKLIGDFGYNCNNYNGKNHLARDCMLKKQEEKKDKVKEESYYTMKIEEVQTKSKNL